MDAALVAVGDDGADYASLVAKAPLVAGTRNVRARLGPAGARIVKA